MLLHFFIRIVDGGDLDALRGMVRAGLGGRGCGEAVRANVGVLRRLLHLFVTHLHVLQAVQGRARRPVDHRTGGRAQRRQTVAPGAGGLLPRHSLLSTSNLRGGGSLLHLPGALAPVQPGPFRLALVANAPLLVPFILHAGQALTVLREELQSGFVFFRSEKRGLDGVRVLPAHASALEQRPREGSWG